MHMIPHLPSFFKSPFFFLSAIHNFSIDFVAFSLIRLTHFLHFPAECIHPEPFFAKN